MLFQYIGPDKDAPQTTKFMGQIDFVLNGEAVEVTDKELVAKLMTNPSFVSEVAAADPDGDYVAALDEAEIFEEDVTAEDMMEVAPAEMVEPTIEEIVTPDVVVPAVPVVTTYAKKRGRPPGATTRT